MREVIELFRSGDYSFFYCLVSLGLRITLGETAKETFVLTVNAAALLLLLFIGSSLRTSV
jgi:hypothetical protein